MDRNIPQPAWRELAQALDVEVAVLQAVAQVESAGSGFLPLPSELPKVLFEGHAFHRLTQGRFDADHPSLSFPKWTKKYYSNATGEWSRLNAACVLDRAAALQSASWGAFQIMGFNYALCGSPDVEAFVAKQRSRAIGQLECFAQFISRQVFLSALQAHDWAKFAAAYNGPRYAENKYDQKIGAAYKAFSQAAVATAAVGRRGKKKAKALPMPAPAIGRPEFAPVPAQRQRVRRRPVKPDRVDLRDWYYRPNVTKAPPAWLMPHNPRVITDQGDTNACTGFALATMVEYLLDRSGRPVERISGHMLYSMARRYDEWMDNDETDEGSSLRGALKGWSRHGASTLHCWDKPSMPKATNKENDWWLDSVRRPLGAYFRMTLNVESDLHSALMDVGVLYASAFTHSGWDALMQDRPHDPPVSPDQIPVIECRKGDEDGGHAFAIVGYTDKGFIVHNSWGPKWGRGGFGILTYSDWRQNAMDCWVAQLGVVTLEHQRVAQASSLRIEGEDADQAPKAVGAGHAVLLSTSPELANHEISPFVIDMQNEGKLSDSGRFRTSDGDLTFLLQHHLQTACERWSIRNGTVDVAIYAHGGLVGEDAAAISARQWIPLLYSNQIFPIYLMWETDHISTVFNIVEDAIKGDDERISANWIERFQQRVVDWKNERIEGLTRKPGGAMWREMKDNANDISATRLSGVVKLFREYTRLSKSSSMPKLRLHLIGHSAGSIVHSHLVPRAIEQGFEIGTVSFLAPAVRIDDFQNTVGGTLLGQNIRLFVAHLIDSAERADPTCKPYGHSLLYLVSRAFEKGADVPILGMEKYLTPTLASNAWGAQVTRLGSPGVAFRSDAQLTVATTHGGLDDDTAVQDAVIHHIKGPAWTGTVVRARGM